MVVEIYKMLVDMADKVSHRRQTANSFYLSVNTGIIGATAYISSIGDAAINILIISLAGMAVSILWKRNIDSYKDLNNGKFEVITAIEQALPLSPFKAEWEFLKRGEDKSRYRPFHAVEVLVPYIFIGVHLLQIVRIAPWAFLLSLVRH